MNAPHTGRASGRAGERRLRGSVLPWSRFQRRQEPGIVRSRLKHRLPTGEIRGAGPRSASLTSSSVTSVTWLLWPRDRRRELPLADLARDGARRLEVLQS